MKKLLLLALLVAFSANSQNLVEIDTVIHVENASKSTLYNRVHAFLTSNIKNQKQKEYLFKTEDKEGGELAISGEFRNNTKVFAGSGYVEDDVSYNFNVYFKEGRIRLIVKDYYHPYFMEAIDELPFPKGRKVGINGKKFYGKVYTEYIGNVKDNLKNIVNNILASVNTQNGVEDDW